MGWFFQRAREAPASAGCAGYTPGSPHRLLFQWHVTERCNLRCAHCYQEAYGGTELDLREQLAVLDQFEALLGKLGSIPGQITLTGGEPFVREDFPALLEEVAKRHRRLGFAILTNGSLLDDERARWLARLGPRFVQVSVEGAPETHDAIRGRGNHARTVAAVERLVRADIPTYLSFTAHRTNYMEFADVARLGRDLGVAKVWADRLIPHGVGEGLSEQLLSPEETHAFIADMQSAREKYENDTTQIALQRALQFLVGGGVPYRCTAGDSLLAMQPNGDLLPCRRLPLKVGNVREQSLSELYFGSDLFQRLRDPEKVADGCGGCAFGKVCGGGLRCLSQAVRGDPFTADPGCWRAASGEREPAAVLPTLEGTR